MQANKQGLSMPTIPHKGEVALEKCSLCAIHLPTNESEINLALFFGSFAVRLRSSPSPHSVMLHFLDIMYLMHSVSKIPVWLLFI